MASSQAYAACLLLITWCCVLRIGVSGELYGDRCTSFWTHCDYEGGFCSPTTDKCDCKTVGHVFNYNSGGCGPERPLGDSCSNNAGCSTSRSLCKDEMCVCQNGFHDNNAHWPGGICADPIALGCFDGCYTHAQCAGDNTVCRNSFCACRVGFYNNNRTDGNGNCEQRIDVMGPCDDVLQSCVEGTECLDGICQSMNSSTCGYGFYGNGRYCKNVDDLNVIGMHFADIAETSMTLRWLVPELVDDIAAYGIAWAPVGDLDPMGNDNGSQVIADPQLGEFTIRGLIPGRAYQVHVSAEEKWSRKKAGLVRYQVSKPHPPGPIDKAASDLDPEDDEVTIKLTPPDVGEFTRFDFIMRSAVSYKGGFSGETVVRRSKNLNVLMYGVDFGTLYRVRNRVCSGHRLSRTICSDTVEETIQLLVAKPSPVSNVEVEVVRGRYFHLEWDPPSKRNGIISHYAVDVYSASDFILFKKQVGMEKSQTTAYDELPPLRRLNATDDETDISGLQKGYFYVFLVYPVNEAGRSERPGQLDSYDLWERSRVLYDMYKAARVPVGTLDERYVTGPARKLKASWLEDGSGTVAIVWNGPRYHSGLLSSYVLGVYSTDGPNRTCFLQVVVKCEGCLADALDLFPNITQKCDNYTAVNISAEEMASGFHYKIYGHGGLLHGYTVSVTTVDIYGDTWTIETELPEYTPDGSTTAATVTPCQSCSVTTALDVIVENICNDGTNFVVKAAIAGVATQEDNQVLRLSRTKPYFARGVSKRGVKRMGSVLIDGGLCRCDPIVDAISSENSQAYRYFVIMGRVVDGHFSVTYIAPYNKGQKRALKLAKKRNGCMRDDENGSKRGKKEKKSKGRKDKSKGRRNKSKGRKNKSKGRKNKSKGRRNKSKRREG